MKYTYEVLLMEDPKTRTARNVVFESDNDGNYRTVNSYGNTLVGKELAEAEVESLRAAEEARRKGAK